MNITTARVICRAAHWLLTALQVCCICATRPHVPRGQQVAMSSRVRHATFQGSTDAAHHPVFQTNNRQQYAAVALLRRGTGADAQLLSTARCRPTSAEVRGSTAPTQARACCA